MQTNDVKTAFVAIGLVTLAGCGSDATYGGNLEGVEVVDDKSPGEAMEQIADLPDSESTKTKTEVEFLLEADISEPDEQLPPLAILDADTARISFFDEGAVDEPGVGVLVSGIATPTLARLVELGASPLQIFESLSPEAEAPPQLIADHERLLAQGLAEENLASFELPTLSLNTWSVTERPVGLDCRDTSLSFWRNNYWNSFSDDFGNINESATIDRDVDVAVGSSEKHAMAACLEKACFDGAGTITAEVVIRKDGEWVRLGSRATLSHGEALQYWRSFNVSRPARMRLRGVSSCEDTHVGAAWVDLNIIAAP